MRMWRGPTREAVAKTPLDHWSFPTILEGSREMVELLEAGLHALRGVGGVFSGLWKVRRGKVSWGEVGMCT